MKKVLALGFFTLSLFPHSRINNALTYSHSDFRDTFKVKHLKKCEIDTALQNVIPENVLVKEKLYLDNKEYYDDLTKKYGTLIGKGHIGPVYIKYIGEPFGYGVFAKKAIKSGAMIGEYTGVVCKIDDTVDAKYAFDYPAVHSGDTVHNDLIIDAYQAGNITRFVNHSADNCNVHVETIPYKNCWHQVFIATRDIKPGEQLLINYGNDYWETLEIVPEPIFP